MRSTIDLESPSILMNLMPMPAGLPSPASAASRFQTTRPTPCTMRDSSFSWSSNLSSVPMAIGCLDLMKRPPREMSAA